MKIVLKKDRGESEVYKDINDMIENYKDRIKFIFLSKDELEELQEVDFEHFTFRSYNSTVFYKGKEIRIS